MNKLSRSVSEVVSVEFYDTTIDCVKEGDVIWVSVRRMCDSLGIASNNQVEKLKNKSWSCDMMIISHDASGRNQSQFFVDLDTVPMWLATIDENRVSEDVRPLLLKYQRECKRVLRDHFFGHNMPKTLADAAEAWAKALREKERVESKLLVAKQENIQLETQIEEDRPKVQFADAVVKADINREVKEFAQVLSGKGIRLGQNNLFRWLRDNKYLHPGKIGWRYSNKPYQRYIDRGWFTVSRRVKETNNGPVDYDVTMITPRGQKAIVDKMERDPDCWAAYRSKEKKKPAGHPCLFGLE